MSKPATASVRSSAHDLVQRLAKFFPDSTPVRIPIHFTRLSATQARVESSVIEFGTPREILFASDSELEFAERLRVENSDGSFDAEASVVAVQYHDGKTAVAARFTHKVANWIVKP